MLEKVEPLPELSDGDEPEEGECDPSRLTVQKKKQFFEQWAKGEKKRPSVLTEAMLRHSLEKASSKVRAIRKMIQKSKTEENKKGKVQRTSRRESEMMVMHVEGGGEIAVETADEFEEAWREVCEQQLLHETLWNDTIGPGYWALEIQKSVQREQYLYKEAAEGAKLVTGKERLEYSWAKLSDEWKVAFKQPLIKAVKVYFDHGALAGLPKHQWIDPKRILMSRFVLTNKERLFSRRPF